MRPLVEAAGFVYVDNYNVTFDAVFQPPETVSQSREYHHLPSTYGMPD